MSETHPDMARWLRTQLDKNPDQTITSFAATHGFNRPSVQKWLNGSLRPDIHNCRQLAEAFNRPVLEVLVAAGHITPDEAGQTPAPDPDPSALSDQQLIAELEARLGRTLGADHPDRETRDQNTVRYGGAGRRSRTVKVVPKP